MPLSALTNTAECRKSRFGKTGRATNGAPAAAAGVATLTVGALADTVEHVGGRLVAAFRERYPHVQVTMVEADLGDPTAGLRAGLVDVALTRTPFDETGITTAVVSTEAVGVVVRTDDPSPVAQLAHHHRRPLRLLWNGMSALAPVGQAVPDGLVVVPADRPPSGLVVAWPKAGAHPLARAFAMIAAG